MASFPFLSAASSNVQKSGVKFFSVAFVLNRTSCYQQTKSELLHLLNIQRRAMHEEETPITIISVKFAILFQYNNYIFLLRL